MPNRSGTRAQLELASTNRHSAKSEDWLGPGTKGLDAHQLEPHLLRFPCGTIHMAGQEVLPFSRNGTGPLRPSGFSPFSRWKETSTSSFHQSFQTNLKTLMGAEKSIDCMGSYEPSAFGGAVSRRAQLPRFSRR